MGDPKHFPPGTIPLQQENALLMEENAKLRGDCLVMERELMELRAEIAQLKNRLEGGR